ncbi:unnamed protein product [Bursaphelenchus okinawaensis]|uniref:MPN domain-containing protein n=1 Tax=Bursaphelenchus okinawaensis TaxID=465554 RepID=A0A811K8G7_9BILA|nr:unnamed protein product [Bursaphelenchus okinawaensis]CAG9094989.1 unnamed protein product [Bursaphelenchus okinawaensis]
MVDASTVIGGGIYDDVDEYLSRQDGKIVRTGTGMMCRHRPQQRCSHCLPVDPYDEDYLKEKEIKHMSFHAYVRKLTDVHGKGTHLKQPLETINCKLDLSCTNHRPYPHGVCTKCRPSTVSLNRQNYRHVDNITIENEDVVNKFLDFWRASSHQRVGYLIGRYEPFADVPLGIKAVVTAIYEPPQSSGDASVKFEDVDPNDEVVDKLCSMLGMSRVGWIFTDLWASDPQAGTVHCTRHKESFLLTAKECITSGAFQTKYKNKTPYCSDGTFGSKFVTLVASGDESKHINFSGYQVSNQCSALVDAEILCPTSHPELAWVREKPLHEKHYITDVQYTEKNEFGAEVLKNGRPMPVEYLLVDVPAGMPKDPCTSFHVVNSAKAFPIENRELIGKAQDPHTVSTYVLDFSSNQFLELISNFHFLLYLLTNNLLKFTEEEVKELCKFVIEHNREGAAEWAEKNQNWATFLELMKSQEGQSANFAAASQAWACKHCTFENTEAKDECAVCGLPNA